MYVYIKKMKKLYLFGQVNFHWEVEPETVPSTEIFVVVDREVCVGREGPRDLF